MPVPAEATLAAIHRKKNDRRPLDELLDMCCDCDAEHELEWLGALQGLLIEVREAVLKSTDRVSMMNTLADMANEVGNRQADAELALDHAKREEEREAREMENPEIYFGAPRRI